MAAAGGAAIQWHPQAAAVIKTPKTLHSPQGETIVEKKALSLQGKPTDMRTAMHHTNAPALVGLSHRGSRLGFREAGITGLTVGVANYGNGYQKSYYTWTTSGMTYSTSALDYVGHSKMDYYSMTIQPLGWYGNSDWGVARAGTTANGNTLLLSNYLGSTATLVGGAAKQTNIAFNVVNEVRPYSPITKITNAGTIVGIAGLAFNVGYNLYQSDIGMMTKTEAWIRNGVSAVEFGLAFVPYVGPFLSVILVAYDLGGGFDDNLYSIGKP